MMLHELLPERDTPRKVLRPVSMCPGGQVLETQVISRAGFRADGRETVIHCQLWLEKAYNA